MNPVFAGMARNLRRSRSLLTVRRQNSTLKLLRLMGLRALGSKTPVPVSLNGRSVLIRPSTSDLQVAYSCLVAGEFNVMRDLVPRETAKFIVDAGGYIGTAALALAEMFPNATIVTLEPSSDNYAMLTKNIAGVKNIVSVKKALLGSARKVTLTDHQLGAWAYSVAGPGTVGAQGELEAVDGITMEELMAQFGATSIDLLKIDIEGSEVEVFKHSAGWMSACHAVIAELHDEMVPGCSAAYRAATAGMRQLESGGEKVVAVRDLQG